MATGFDELLDFLLSEIALLGVQGASSADFRRFIKKFYGKSHDDTENEVGNQGGISLPADVLGRSFYERTWQWLTSHPDIRIVYQKEVRDYTLSEFEAAELHETGTTGDVHAAGPDQQMGTSSTGPVQPSKTLTALGEALRQRIREEKGLLKEPTDLSNQAMAPLPARRPPRNLPEALHTTTAVFDEPSSSMTAPRLYTSQGRVWQALTGHGIDLKKVPSMEFVLLSLIAARGAAGITQPELIGLSGQDKRSVPHRTDELARKNYISKYPVQSNKMRTSLCIHTKFVSQNAFIESSAVEDVYQEDGTFVVRSFAQLLYNKLGEGGIVPTRTIREKLGVPMSSWNKRATQGALIRLDQSGMIKRRRIRKKKTGDAWITCIQVMRAPRDEDLKNLGFRRTADLTDGSNTEPLDEDADGDSVMKDLEVDMLEDAETNADSQTLAQPVDEPKVIPPQWTPDRFLPNIVFDAVVLGGPEGWDSEALRDRIVGPFWRRPMESYFSRITNDWEKTQPIHLRHLAVIRDQGVTKEKKFLHYVYRTYANFEKAVELEYAHWGGVADLDSNEPFDPSRNHAMLDPWGFPIVKPGDLVRGSGSATLSEAGSAVVKPRKYGPRWDIALAQEIGYKKSYTPAPKIKTPHSSVKPKKPKVVKEKPARVAKAPKPPKASALSLTPDEKISLGLDPNARLGAKLQKQILAYRQMTGDPAALPDAVAPEKTSRQLSVPLMSKEERIAAGLSPRGRLGIEQENKIREERGLPTLVKKEKKRVTKFTKEATLLSKQQRISLGWKGHGRLPQDLIEGLRREREEGIALEDSKVILSFMDEMRAKATKPETPKKTTAPPGKSITPVGEQEQPLGNLDTDNVSKQNSTEPEAQEVLLSTGDLGKRKAEATVATPASRKKQRTKEATPQKSTPVPISSPTSSPADVAHPIRSGTLLANPDEHDTEVTTPLIVANVSEAAQSIPSAAEEYVPPNSEAACLPKPLEKTYMMPDTSKLDAAARTALKQYEQRTSPGIYLNPYMKQNVGRGRPRKAIMATFKLSRLAEMDWFKAADDQEHPMRGDDVAQIPGTPQTDVANQTEEAIGSRQTSCAADSTKLHVHTQPSADVETQQNLQSHTPPPSISDETILSEPRDLPATRGNSAEAPTQPVKDSATASNEAEADAAAVAVPSEAEDRPHSLLDTTERQPRPVASIPPRMVGGWAPINASERSRASSYHSPYADSSVEETRPSLPDASTAHGINAALTTATGLQLPTSERNDNHTLHGGLHSAIVEAPVPLLPGTKPRAKESGIGGSQRHFRQRIILDIIKRCNGVFPGGGEILRPFLTLWRERHAQIKEPSLSTISETLRSMACQPKFGLKHWNFAAQNKNTPGTTTRRMFTWANLTERSPEVLRLAHNMAQYSQQKEYTARVSEKSLLYYPDEIRDLIGEVVSYQPVQAAPKDESIVLNRLNPELEKQINDAKLRRRSELNKQKRLEEKARKVQNAQVEQALSKQPGDAPRAKRARLASLNDKSKHIRRAPLYTEGLGTLDDEFDDAETGGRDHSAAEKPGQISLVWTRPIVAPVPEREPVPEGDQFEDDESDDEPPDWVEQEMRGHVANAEAPIEEYPSKDVTTGEPDSAEARENLPKLPDDDASTEPATAQKNKKRVIIPVPRDQSSRKRVRLAPAAITDAQDGVNTPHSSSDDNAKSDSEAMDDREEDGKAVRRTANKQSVRTFQGRQRGKHGPPPTLLERLTGLTGDPNDPIYQPPQRGSRPGMPSRPWNERKKISINRHKKQLQYAEVIEQVDEFKKLFCTFVVVSSLSGEDGQMDWNLVQNAHANGKLFNLNRARQLWAWIQNHMPDQSLYLEAYEAGKVATIQDPETHDWAGLVRWAIRKCPYPDLPLPILQEAMQQLTIEESSYENLDRLQHSFTTPLHRSRTVTWSSEDKLLKARSWIRANTATPQALYDADLAHEKFKDLGETVLVHVVGDFVDKQHIRMRKLKRLLPGRNYNFTQALAKKYTRLFQLDDFMHAVEVKKKMDAAFTSEDPEMRSYNMSRCEEDGSFAAIMTMVSDGTVKLAPQLPPVHDDFNAPLPKLSAWGFCEGGYNHRAIDRSRLFWDIHVVPTDKYKFGNPLQTLPQPSPPTDNLNTAVWNTLPEPPLPGKHDASALLPIWSSIDGRNITWPWWYRVLNLVLQPLIFLAGATAADVLSHCPENTTELFEIELVLNWLESVGAVEKTIGGGYITLPGFWAAFGDRLHDTESDWFGEHVKRKAKNHEKQRWRMDYNLRHSTLQARATQRTDASVIHEEGDTAISDAGAVDTNTSRQILKNPKQQYRIMQQTLNTQQVQNEQDQSDPSITDQPTNVDWKAQLLAAAEPGASISRVSKTLDMSAEDVDMADADVDAEGEDIDAEGEDDDDMY
ncbi:tfiiic transcription initiation factor complex subunits protein [Stemphylium lycopersici]|uniref:Tfiiic transcription initiation factor complex subunits protein n=1 Tax=Stemphylium lycopersici TaxID=183478 RepID=A0A364MYF4_STELY|nr:tfiiic transcription initiation factor complex subunits protein [Stemphylium lycopersici]